MHTFTLHTQTAGDRKCSCPRVVLTFILWFPLNERLLDLVDSVALHPRSMIPSQYITFEQTDIILSIWGEIENQACYLKLAKLVELMNINYYLSPSRILHAIVI